jgi:hypothetical protein
MTTEMNRPGASKFVALERAIEIAESLRHVLRQVRRYNVDIARQIERSACSIAANLAEGNRRQGKDRAHFFRIAAEALRSARPAPRGGEPAFPARYRPRYERSATYPFPRVRLLRPSSRRSTKPIERSAAPIPNHGA